MKKIIYVNDTQTPFDYLFENKAEVMITDLQEALYRQCEGFFIGNKSNPFTTDHTVFLVAKENRLLLEKLNKWLIRNGY